MTPPPFPRERAGTPRRGRGALPPPGGCGLRAAPPTGGAREQPPRAPRQRCAPLRAQVTPAQAAAPHPRTAPDAPAGRPGRRHLPAKEMESVSLGAAGWLNARRRAGCALRGWDLPPPRSTPRLSPRGNAKVAVPSETPPCGRGVSRLRSSPAAPPGPCAPGDRGRQGRGSRRTGGASAQRYGAAAVGCRAISAEPETAHGSPGLTLRSSERRVVGGSYISRSF